MNVLTSYHRYAKSTVQLEMIEICSYLRFSKEYSLVLKGKYHCIYGG